MRASLLLALLAALLLAPVTSTARLLQAAPPPAPLTATTPVTVDLKLNGTSAMRMNFTLMGSSKLPT